MTLTVYTNDAPRPPAGAVSPAPHIGVRAGLVQCVSCGWHDQNAVQNADWRQSATTDQVGTTIIDRIGELDAKALHVLAMVFAMLVRMPRRN